MLLLPRWNVCDSFCTFGTNYVICMIPINIISAMDLKPIYHPIITQSHDRTTIASRRTVARKSIELASCQTTVAILAQRRENWLRQ